MSVLSKVAKKLFEGNILNRKLHTKVGKELFSKWNIPLNITNDLLNLRKDVTEVSDYILYHLIIAIDKNSLPQGYPPEHLKDEFNKPFKNETVKFPLVYSVIQIDNFQYVGKITARELFNLGNNALLNYNENTQRVMRRVITPNGEHYEITKNERAINHIEESYKEKKYIPNTITLNIPYDDDSDFYYDEDSCKLIINKIKNFDLLDGYHRYVAMNRICAFDSDFDYPMELRIVIFTEEKARYFIYQEDQKTKMSKVASNSLNKYNPANIIVNRIQNSTYGNIVAYNKGIISSSILSDAIRIIYGINVDKTYKPSEINAISKEIINGFDELIENDPTIFDSQLDGCDIYCIVSMIKNKYYDTAILPELLLMIKDRYHFNKKTYLKLKDYMERRGSNV